MAPSAGDALGILAFGLIAVVLLLIAIVDLFR